jgi:hypothetical protein
MRHDFGIKKSEIAGYDCQIAKEKKPTSRFCISFSLLATNMVHARSLLLVSFLALCAGITRATPTSTKKSILTPTVATAETTTNSTAINSESTGTTVSTTSAVAFLHPCATDIVYTTGRYNVSFVTSSNFSGWFYINSTILDEPGYPSQEILSVSPNMNDINYPVRSGYVSDGAHSVTMSRNATNNSYSFSWNPLLTTVGTRVRTGTWKLVLVEPSGSKYESQAFEMKDRPEVSSKWRSLLDL